MRTEEQIKEQFHLLQKEMTGCPAAFGGCFTIVILVLGWVLGQHQMTPVEALTKLQQEAGDEIQQKS